MPKNNPYLIKENYKKVEIVQELKDEYKVPSYEEFMKTYEPSEEVEIITEAEYQDRVLNGSQFGPGNEQSRGVAKKIGSIALATTYFTPLGAITGPMTVVAGATGGSMYLLGKATSSEDLRDAGGLIFGTAFDAGIEGIGAGALNGASSIAKLTKEACKVINELGDMKDKIEALERRGVYIPAGTPQQRADFVNNILKYGL